MPASLTYRSRVHDPQVLRQDFAASLVVFLVAVPLCIGVAVASGTPAELGLVTGIVGGLVVGALPGSRLQVSGPAAGLTVLVFEAVTEHGLGTLGVIVLTAGVLQLVMGALRMGHWFRAISTSVVHGMLAGIGLVLISGQVYALLDERAPGGALHNLATFPGAVGAGVHDAEAVAAAALGVGTILVLSCWRHAPLRLRAVPAPLVAVLLASLATVALRLPVQRIEVRGLAGVVHLPTAEDIASLAQTGVLGAAVAFALIASAESLFSAAAVDQMHDGPRTRYNQELVAQGVGNTVCGLLGALPLTAVIVRSAANVRAGARTRASRILHGLWLLVFTALLPATLGLIPVATLAAVLIHAGWKLVPTRTLAKLWRTERGEAAVLGVTTLAILATNLLEGVVVGLVLAVAKAAWEVSHLHVRIDASEDVVTVWLSGNATFLRLPRLLDTLEALPPTRPVELDVSGLSHLDHACRAALLAWVERHNGRGSEVRIRPAAQREGWTRPADTGARR